MGYFELQSVMTQKAMSSLLFEYSLLHFGSTNSINKLGFFLGM